MNAFTAIVHHLPTLAELYLVINAFVVMTIFKCLLMPLLRLVGAKLNKGSST